MVARSFLAMPPALFFLLHACREHVYEVPIGTPIVKDGEPYPPLDWDEPGYGFGQSPLFDQQIDELYDALTATFAPGLPVDPDCLQSGACIAGSFGQVAYMFFPELRIGMSVASYTAGVPVTNTIVQMQMFAP